MAKTKIAMSAFIVALCTPAAAGADSILGLLAQSRRGQPSGEDGTGQTRRRGGSCHDMNK